MKKLIIYSPLLVLLFANCKNDKHGEFVKARFNHCAETYKKFYGKELNRSQVKSMNAGDVVKVFEKISMTDSTGHDSSSPDPCDFTALLKGFVQKNPGNIDPPRDGYPDVAMDLGMSPDGKGHLYYMSSSDLEGSGGGVAGMEGDPEGPGCHYHIGMFEGETSGSMGVGTHVLPKDPNKDCRKTKECTTDADGNTTCIVTIEC